MKLKRSSTSDGEHYGWLIYCPGCDDKHLIPTRPSAPVVWGFNDNLDSPTFTPSVKHTWRGEDDGKPVEQICHYIITNGQIAFCDDCFHSLKGKTVPMVDVPEWDEKEKS